MGKRAREGKTVSTCRLPLSFSFLRACLKRGDSREMEEVHLEYEHKPIVPNRSYRPSVGLYQRPDSSCKVRRPTPHAGNASGGQCDVVPGSYGLSMAHGTTGISGLAKCLHLLSPMA